MRTIICVLCGVASLAALTLILVAPSLGVVLICLALLGVVALLAYGAWGGEFGPALMAAPISAAMAGMAAAALVKEGLGWWPAAAGIVGLLAGAFVLVWASATWDAGIRVLPIELLVLRDKNTLALTVEPGPGRVICGPFREVFARLPLLSQEFLHQVHQVDLVPDGAAGAASCQPINTVAVEASFSLRPDRALHIFGAPGWQEHVIAVLRRDSGLRDFLAALKDHGVWQEVFRAVVVQQIELAVRRAARECGLQPHQLSARRDAFEARVGQNLRAMLGAFGLELSGFDVMRIDTAESAAAQQGRAYETLAAAELRARGEQLQLAIDHIDANGLPRTPEMLETVLLLLGGMQGRIALIRSRRAPLPFHADDEQLIEAPALQERAVGG